MPRRKFRLTMPKRREHKPRAYNAELDVGVPTETEWATMLPFSSFLVNDNEECIFKRGDIALLLPSFVTPEEAEDLEEYDFWVARIRDIRAKRTTDQDFDVWVLVQWYYSAKDVAEIIKSFNTNTCGKYERIFSDHRDFVHADSFSAVMKMTRLKDQKISQPYIGREDFYCRYNFEVGERRLEPRVKDTACPICNAPYSPDDSRPENVMHFCPRPSCRRFYHEKCLKHSDQQNSLATLLRITTWPNTDDVLSIADLSSVLHSPMKRRRKKWEKDGTVQVRESASEEPCSITMDCLSSLPEQLLKVAEQPIVRGAAFVQGGVSGNVASVVLARQIIYDVLQGASVPEDWQRAIDVPRSIVTLKIGSKKKRVANGICPKCQSAI